MGAIALDKIRLDGDCQGRAMINWPFVQELVGVIKERGRFHNDIVVYDDGEICWLADGFHRVQAARQVGLVEIDADARRGGKAEAAWYAASANIHGERRTNSDKRRAVTMALHHQKSKGLSDRAIAEHCGVSDVFVGEIRSQVQTACTPPQPRKGKDGKTYKPKKVTEHNHSKTRRTIAAKAEERTAARKKSGASPAYQMPREAPKKDNLPRESKAGADSAEVQRLLREIMKLTSAEQIYLHRAHGELISQKDKTK